MAVFSRGFGARRRESDPRLPPGLVHARTHQAFHCLSNAIVPVRGRLAPARTHQTRMKKVGMPVGEAFRRRSHCRARKLGRKIRFRAFVLRRPESSFGPHDSAIMS